MYPLGLTAWMAAFIALAAVPICATIEPPPEPWLPLPQNFMNPNRTPVTLSTRFFRTRLAMSIFFSVQAPLAQKPSW